VIAARDEEFESLIEDARMNLIGKGEFQFPRKNRFLLHSRMSWRSRWGKNRNAVGFLKGLVSRRSVGNVGLNQVRVRLAG
jgi:hypothetical protein